MILSSSSSPQIKYRSQFSYSLSSQSPSPILATSLYNYHTNLEWEVFDVMLHRCIGPFATDQSFGIENGVLRIDGELILSSVTNQTFTIWSESNVRWRDSITLVVGDDFHASIFEHADTEKIDTYYTMTITTHIPRFCILTMNTWYPDRYRSPYPPRLLPSPYPIRGRIRPSIKYFAATSCTIPVK